MAGEMAEEVVKKMAQKRAIFSMVICLGLALPSASLIVPSSAMAAQKGAKAKKKKKPKTEVKEGRVFKTDPLKKGPEVKFSHAPFHLAPCGICHEHDDPKKPGKIRGGDSNKICLSCHKPTMEDITRHKNVHKPVEKDCSFCHNPHNSKYRFLLYEPPKKLCNSCHVGIKKIVNRSKVKHDAVSKGKTCRNCHRSHSSNVQHLLRGLPSDMCNQCHGKDDLKDHDKKPLINIQKLVKKNKFKHEPIVKKDCSACHATHGGRHYRLLLAPYPHEFYAKYTKEAYGLCLRCHKEEKFLTEKETTTATKFRDGKTNLHYAHVVAPKKGRTCRACHGEHASEREHLIRKDVPYGNAGWRLEVNFVKTKNGGRCAKTCHDTKEYKR